MVKRTKKKAYSKPKIQKKTFKPIIKKCNRVNQVIGSCSVVYGACGSCGIA